MISSNTYNSSPWVATGFALVLASISLAVSTAFYLGYPVTTTATTAQSSRKTTYHGFTGENQPRRKEDDDIQSTQTPESEPSPSIIRFACLGNSMQYFNDCPRLLARVIQECWGVPTVQQDSCLRGGASLLSLWVQGNGMQTKFATPPAALPNSSSKSSPLFDIGAPTVEVLLQQSNYNEGHGWDFVLMNDHTLAPAREKTRTQTIRALKKQYLPLLLQQQPTVIFLQTPAYRKSGIRNSHDLGNFASFTDRLTEGYLAYQQCLQQASIPAVVAPVGHAFAYIKNTAPGLWRGLYHSDDFHPSPHGTLLQAYVILHVMAQQQSMSNSSSSSSSSLPEPTPVAPSRLSFAYSSTWWDQARVMQPQGEPPLARPTLEEARLLWDVAVQVTSSCNSATG